MNAELKAKWIAALRSGDYAQGTGALRTPIGFCCLGVLCDVSGIGAWEEGYKSNRDGLFIYYKTPRSDEQDAMLPPELSLPMNLIFELWQMNDLRDKSFAEIADYIEAHL